MSYPNRGGRIAPDNRGASAPGVGKNSKRHDLERRSTPFLHDSDLQQGDVQAMENGQRIAPKQTQQPAAPAPTGGSGKATEPAGTSTTGIPDAIDFIGQIAGGGGLTAHGAGAPPSPNMEAWLEFTRHLVNGPGASGLLAGAYISQMRQARRFPQNASSRYIDMNDVDDSIEVVLDEQQLMDEDAGSGS